MKKELLTKFTRTLGKFELSCKRHAPEVMVVAGVVGVVASAVMACKATTKAGAIKEEFDERMEVIHETSEKYIPQGSDEYTEEDMKKDTVIVYTQAAVKYVKLYAPSVALGILSIATILTSHHILRKRNIALAAAYTAVDKGFKEYRERVIDRFGKELDKELRYNIKAKTIEKTIIDENGKETVVTETVDVIDPNEYSIYARFFDEGCIGWEKDAEYNLMFLKLQQDHANELLKSRGYLFLNEVYDMLGIQKTKAGQTVGWVYDEEYPVGDNFVDFGIYNVHNERNRAFVNGYERNILLDFNVDGDIMYVL